MTIQAGFSDQLLISDLLNKVQQARQQAPHSPIEVDGGITLETIGVAGAIIRLPRFYRVVEMRSFSEERIVIPLPPGEFAQ